MKIKIGPYRSWIGPYQIADCFKFFGLSEAACDWIGERLNHSPVRNICEWIQQQKKRKIKIQIDSWDTWNMDHTLSLIILPLLKQLRDTKHGAPNVDDSDVPDELKSTSAPPKKYEWDTDANHFLRWDWVLDQMIWTFEQNVSDWESQFHSGNSDISFEPISDTDCYELVTGPNDTRKFDKEGYDLHFEKMQNGMRLFAKYFYSLWD